MSDATPPADVSVKPPRRFRRLRIFVSVFFCALAVALCVLWASSYTWNIGVNRTGLHNNSVSLFSMNGAVRCNGRTVPGIMKLIPGWTVTFRSSEVERYPRKRWEFRLTQTDFRTAVPHWSLILVCYFLAELTRIPLLDYRISFRFALRTLLIATTLVAAALGLVCFAFR